MALLNFFMGENLQLYIDTQKIYTCISDHFPGYHGMYTTQNIFKVNSKVNIDYNMAFSISALVSSQDSHISPRLGIMGTKSITVCWIDLLLVIVDWTELLLTEHCSNCSIFIVLNSRHDTVNINIRHHLDIY